jgi:hypothetical protein
MPYRMRKPFVIVNGQRLVNPSALPQRLPLCDSCDELTHISENRYTELAPDKWWKWFSYPKFACEEEAFMGCEKHPVEPEIHFLDGRVERYTRLPLTRWQRMKEPDALILAAVLALFFAIIVGWILK